MLIFFSPAAMVSANCRDTLLADTLPVTNTALAPALKTHEFLPPAIMIGYGFLSLGNKAVRRLDFSVQADMSEDHPGFVTTADNFIQYTPAAATFALGLAGLKGRSSFVDRSLSFALSMAIMNTAVVFLKREVGRERPDGSSTTSFPSGHTALAFVGAEMMYQEYGYRSLWFGVAGYSLATATGILRVYNNVHWLSDIVAGAGFGILSTKLAYAIYPQLKKRIFGNRAPRLTFLPAIINKKTAFTLNYKFR
ncbi:phosphatase PAP2 family protein [Hufsiella ginkgonis]|uniref:Phosphatase PAP2 family protein n=1 Tax=Hufsiella ginkgonis TaxID=2695274 RepID=A0A7K1XSQ9_9SPHI|nr:phosphatase PAP2 family protein [Hufsiella ginkgonis]MXV14035.1 phosphatase PAP2 family protein [Hufsiella ginkgonis]